MMARVFFVGQLLCLLGTCFAQVPTYRLPTSITPLRYDLRLNPDINRKAVFGSVFITFKTTDNQSESITSVSLHLGVDGTIEEDSVTLLELSGQKKTFGAIEYDDRNTMVKLVLPEGDSFQYNQEYIIYLHFTSLLYSEPTGLFTGVINKTSNYIASNFRPTFARNVFPCFDEPQFKTPVKLQVLRPASYSAVSTAPLVHSSEVKASGMFIDTFKTTSPISIHSLGLFISQLSPLESHMGVTLYAPSEIPASVPFLHSLLNNIRTAVGPFPVTPLNLVVLPDRLQMHLASYGFVFTSVDIYDYNEQKPRFAAHVWASLRIQLAEAFLRQFLEFSKTPSWWSDIWLSESIGAFLASYIQPEAFHWLKVKSRSDVLRVNLDYPNEPVINSQILSHWDIEKAITSQSVRDKGLGVLTMWSDTLPEGVVVKSILDYIKLPDSVVTTSDFLSVLVGNIEVNKTYDVTPAIENLPLWLNASGHPTVTYSLETNLGFQLTQWSRNNNEDSKFWPVSISFAQNSSQDWNNYRWGLWLLNGSSSFSPEGFEANQWTIFNLESGLYRLDYGPSWGLIQNALKRDLVPSKTTDSVKATIQDDAVALCLQGNLSFSTTFEVLSSTQHYMLDWYPVAKAFAAFTNKIGNDNDIYDEFSMFAASLFSEELLAILDLQNRSTDPRVQYIRSVMTPWLCEFNIGNFRQVVALLFDQLLRGDIKEIHPGDLENVACYGALYNSSVLDSLLLAYSTTSSPWLKHLYTIGLGCLSDTLSVQRVLDSLISTAFTRGEAKRIIVNLASKIQNAATLIDFVSQQAASIQSVLGSGCLGDVLLTLGKLRIDLSKVESLGNDPSVDPYVAQSAMRAVSRTNASRAWWSNNAADLDAALPQKRKTTTKTTTETPSPTTAVTPTSTTSFTVSTTTETTIPATTSVTTATTGVTTGTTTTAGETTTAAGETTTTARETTTTARGTTTTAGETTTPATTGTAATTTSGTTVTLPPTQGTTTGSTSAPSSCPKSLSNMKLFTLVLPFVIMVLFNTLFKI